MKNRRTLTYPLEPKDMGTDLGIKPSTLSVSNVRDLPSTFSAMAVTSFTLMFYVPTLPDREHLSEIYSSPKKRGKRNSSKPIDKRRSKTPMSMFPSPSFKREMLLPFYFQV